MCVDRPNAMRVERAKFSIKPFLFADNAEIIARETKSENIKFWHFFKIYFLNGSTDDSFFVPIVNVAGVSLACVSIVIICPYWLNLIDSIIVLSRRTHCTKSKPSGTGE